MNILITKFSLPYSYFFISSVSIVFFPLNLEVKFQTHVKWV